MERLEDRHLLAAFVGYWQFDDGGGTIAADSAGLNDGTLVNGPTWSTGITNSALEFDGINDFVQIPHSNSLDLVASVTMEAWVLFDAVDNTYDTLLSKIGDSGTIFTSYELSRNRTGNFSEPWMGKLASNVITTAGRSALNSSFVPNVGEWYHIISTYDGITHALYINGQLDASAAHSGALITNNNPLLIGRGYFGADEVKGRLDDVGVASVAMTAAEVLSRYLSGPQSRPVANAGGPYVVQRNGSVLLDASSSRNGVIEYEWDFDFDGTTFDVDATGVAPILTGDTITGSSVSVAVRVTDSLGQVDLATGSVMIVGATSRWEFNDATGNTATDSIGNNHATLLNGPTWTTGLIDGALNFDGINDYLLVPDADALDLPQEITVEAWVRFASVNNHYDSILYKIDYQAPDLINYSLVRNRTGDLSQAWMGRLSFGVTTTTGVAYVQSATVPVAGEWYYVVGTYDGSHQSLYVNGQLETVIPRTGPIRVGTDELWIGRSPYGGNEWLNGDVDEVVIHNEALTAAQIQARYHQVTNLTPTADPGGPYEVAEGSSVQLDGSGSSDPQNDIELYEWDFDYDTMTFDVHATGVMPVFSAAGLNGPLTRTIALRVTDAQGASSIATTTVAVTEVNDAPDIFVDHLSVNVDEGDIALNSGTFLDPDDDDIVTLTASTGTLVQDPGNAGNWTWMLPTFDDLTTTTVIITATDSNDLESVVTFELTVHNVAPMLDNVTFQLTENRPTFTSVGTISAIDPGDDVLTYQITGGTGAEVFAIDTLTGAIWVADGDQLDYETSPFFELEVQVFDHDGGEGLATVTIEMLNQASISGVVFLDVNGNGDYDANEPGIDDVTVELRDEFGAPVLDEHGEAIRALTGGGGYYLFEDLDPGVYELRELQPTGVDDGPELLGSLDGIVLANDRIQLVLARTDAFDYAFAELGQQIAAGDSAGIGFWQNRHGQALIAQGGPALAQWLTTNFQNIFGDRLATATGQQVAEFYRDQLFKQQAKKGSGPARVDAQFMAVALATFFTSHPLAGYVAENYGFHVTQTGIGTKVVNVGHRGAAFGVDNGTSLTIMQLLQATNAMTDVPDHQSGFASVYDRNGDGIIDAEEAQLRTWANEIFSWINEDGQV